MKRTITLFFGMVLVQSIFSQPKSSIPGYIITMNNDTISGYILVDTKGNIGYISSIKCWDPISKKGRNYGADKTKAFGYGDRYFESLVWDGTHNYFERIVKGSPVALYVTASTSPGLIIPVKITHNEYFIVDNSSMTRLQRMGFKKFMMNYVKSCSVLKDRLETEKLGYNNLVEIIQEYNLCSSNNK